MKALLRRIHVNVQNSSILSTNSKVGATSQDSIIHSGCKGLTFCLLYSHATLSPKKKKYSSYRSLAHKCQISCLSPVQTNAILLDVTCCVRLPNLLHVVARSLKPGKRLATCKRTQQLPTLLGQQVGSCCVRFQVALHFFSLYLAQGIVCPSPARAHRVQHFPPANQLRQHC